MSACCSPDGAHGGPLVHLGDEVDCHHEDYPRFSLHRAWPCDGDGRSCAQRGLGFQSPAEVRAELAILWTSRWSTHSSQPAGDTRSCEQKASPAVVICSLSVDRIGRTGSGRLFCDPPSPPKYHV
jgi:hypothetical protein